MIIVQNKAAKKQWFLADYSAQPSIRKSLKKISIFYHYFEDSVVA